MRLVIAVLLGGCLIEAAATMAAGQDAAQVYKPGNGVTLPELVKEVRPSYTPAAMEQRIQGYVLLEAVVQADGTVGDVTVRESLDAEYGLDEQAIAALKQWMFKPGTREGKPVAVQIAVQMAFTLK
jgi:protein TonB